MSEENLEPSQSEMSESFQSPPRKRQSALPRRPLNHRKKGNQAYSEEGRQAGSKNGYSGNGSGRG